MKAKYKVIKRWVKPTGSMVASPVFNIIRTTLFGYVIIAEDYTSQQEAEYDLSLIKSGNAQLNSIYRVIERHNTICGTLYYLERRTSSTWGKITPYFNNKPQALVAMKLLEKKDRGLQRRAAYNEWKVRVNSKLEEVLPFVLFVLVVALLYFISKSN